MCGVCVVLAYGPIVFLQDLVIGTQGSKEQDALDAVKTLDPLTTLRALSPNVHKAV